MTRKNETPFPITIGDRFQARPQWPHMPFADCEITITKLLQDKGDPRNWLYQFITDDGQISECRGNWLKFWKRVEADAPEPDGFTEPEAIDEVGVTEEF